MPTLSYLGTSMSMFVLLGACHNQEIDDRANEKVADVRAKTDREFVYPSCADHQPLGPNCGLLLTHAASEGFRVRFRDQKCIGKLNTDCQMLYQQAIDSWLQQRYFATDWQAVARTCELKPGLCDDLKEYELRILDSHNMHIRDDRARSENEIEAARNEAQRQHAAAMVTLTNGIIGDIAYAAHQGPKCRSYPSLADGVTNTTCTP